ncbi:transcriptional regulator [Brevibacterium samyangense]|uniref:transcriptional regulator n=1 Tax=Brevibacterium samyangense TaxID=366888 RepID=UPI0031DEDBE6
MTPLPQGPSPPPSSPVPSSPQSPSSQAASPDPAPRTAGSAAGEFGARGTTAGEFDTGAAAAIALLSPVLANPARLALVAGLRDSQRRHFASVRDSLGVSDSVLSKHASTLEKEGLIEVSKSFVGRRPATWYRITPEGIRVLESHLEGLRLIAGGRFPAE